jgi:hypothetical protein
LAIVEQTAATGGAMRRLTLRRVALDEDVGKSV